MRETGRDPSFDLREDDVRSSDAFLYGGLTGKDAG